jgi:hypothetical protein
LRCELSQVKIRRLDRYKSIVVVVVFVRIRSLLKFLTAIKLSRESNAAEVTVVLCYCATLMNPLTRTDNDLVSPLNWPKVISSTAWQRPLYRFGSIDCPRRTLKNTATIREKN